MPSARCAYHPLPGPNAGNAWEGSFRGSSCGARVSDEKGCSLSTYDYDNQSVS
jgi:hypothetical protein